MVLKSPELVASFAKNVESLYIYIHNVYMYTIMMFVFSIGDSTVGIMPLMFQRSGAYFAKITPPRQSVWSRRGWW